MEVAMYQKGNILPYVLAMLVALMMSGQYVFNSYKLSNESTRMQNTTDSAAYSVATVYAQNYNFVGLSNRALVANQITMAQVVTMVSWGRMLGTFSTTIDDIGQFIPYINTVTRYVEQVGKVIQRGLERIVPPLTKIIQTYIVANSTLQRAAVPMVSLISQEILEEVVEKNDSDVEYSLATIPLMAGSVAHLSELYGQNDCKKQADRVRNRQSSNGETIARCRQFRNVTLASRDGFTENRTYRFPLPLPNSAVILPGPAEFVPGVPLYSTLTIERAGGTTMGGDTPGVQRSTPFTTWSALDTISLHSSTKYLRFPDFKVKKTDHEEKLKLGVGSAYVGNECSKCHHIINEGTNYWRKNPRGSACTDPDRGAGYGGGHKSRNDGVFFLFDVFSLNCNKLSNDYGRTLNGDKNVGLTNFYNLKTEGYVEEKDQIMVYLRKKQSDVSTASQTVGSSKDDVILDRYQGAHNNSIHGAAAAAVYFRRANDKWMLASARRLDGRIEFGNAYNPFWEARLSKLTATQRVTLEAMKEL